MPASAAGADFSRLTTIRRAEKTWRPGPLSGTSLLILTGLSFSRSISTQKLNSSKEELHGKKSRGNHSACYVVSLFVAGCTLSTNSNQAASSAPSALVTPSATPTPSLTPSGTQFVLVQGQQFSIALRSNPTTPYHWELTFDTGVIALKNQTYVSDPQPSTPVPGRGGTEVFTFQALRVGTTNIAFHHIQSWGSSAVITTSAAKTTSAEDSSYTVTVH